MPRSPCLALLAAAAAALSVLGAGPPACPLRPPAVPLVTADPYLSIWSEADRLTDHNTRHWTGHAQSLYGMVRVDGHPFRLMGVDPAGVPAMPQVGLTVTPTRTTYDFEGGGVRVTLTFLTPLLPHDVDLMGRPLTYLTYTVRVTDSGRHDVQLLDATSSQLAVDSFSEPVTWGRQTAGDLTLLRTGTARQRRLGNPGDDTRIDWGYAYTAARSGESTAALGGTKAVLAAFAEGGKLPAADDARQPRPVNDDPVVCAFAHDCGTLSADTNADPGTPPAVWQVMVAYDEVEAVNYFGRPLPPYWRRDGDGPAELFRKAAADYAKLVPRCDAFDAELVADARRLGGDAYADIVALAYRQAWAGCGLVADANKKPLLLTKENTSNGDIATVDVIFPMDPIWVLLSPTLAKATLVSNLDYSASSHWRFPNAPHDLGTYPIVMGRDDGGEGMPVEESGNMLILCDAIAQAEGSAAWVDKWWPQLTQWATYLEKYGLDPENQLCTDDFMGHLAHNANLSVKAIVALAAYGDLCKMRGDTANADKYMNLARADAAHWMTAAGEGDHYKLAFDRAHTWSQKYNLVWDRILNLDVFPPEVAAKEVAFYKTQLQPFGLPLDSRTKLTKTDWSVWSATLATDPKDFRAIVDPIVTYLNQTTTREPFPDSYVTTDVNSGGMHARPVIGGVFIKFLGDRDTWHKWASRDTQKVSDWAPLPTPPKVTLVVPTSAAERVDWQYTTEAPQGDAWTRPDFKADGWRTARGGFGTVGPAGSVHTRWNTPDLWVRRTVTLPADLGNTADLQFVCYHDEDVQVFVDGVPAADETGFNSSYLPLTMSAEARGRLKPGATVTIAAHCHQTTGGQGLDLGIGHVVRE